MCLLLYGSVWCVTWSYIQDVCYTATAVADGIVVNAALARLMDDNIIRFDVDAGTVQQPFFSLLWISWLPTHSPSAPKESFWITGNGLVTCRTHCSYSLTDSVKTLYSVSPNIYPLPVVFRKYFPTTENFRVKRTYCMNLQCSVSYTVL